MTISVNCYDYIRGLYLAPVDLGVWVCGNLSVDGLQVSILYVRTKQVPYGVTELVKPQALWNRGKEALK